MPSEPAPLFIIRPQGRPAYSVNLDQLTDIVRVARTVRKMSYVDKLKRAAHVVEDLEVLAERDADALIARGAELDAKRARAFAAHHTRLDAGHDALDRLEHALDAMGNGPPPDGSNDGSEAGATLKPAAMAQASGETERGGNAYRGTTAEG